MKRLKKDKLQLSSSKKFKKREDPNKQNKR